MKRFLAAWLAIAMLVLAGCGGGGGSGSPPAPTVTGSLAVGDCEIADGESTCLGSISWTSNAAAPRILLAGATLATTTAGAVTSAVGLDRLTVALFDGTTRLDEKSIGGSCAAASAWAANRCAAFASRTTERIPTPFVEAGRAVTLEVVIYTPPGTGPFPLVMFSHGSTGNGDDPSQFRLTYTNEAIARFFNERGWIVAFPQRRGRGGSDGLYDEGFTPDRSAYSCLQGPALAGLERALQDSDVALDYLRARTGVDNSRMLAAGISRGGALAVAHAGRRPAAFIGVVNFVGGWLGEGCVDAAVVNRTALVSGASFPGQTTWLYGANDSFYSVAHSRANYDAFVAAGGRGAFSVYTRAAGLNGHFIINDSALWSSSLDAYVKQVGG